jgi:hypothetical protein
MAIVATVTLIDSLNSIVKKRYETETDVIATAQAVMADVIDDLEAVTDLGVVSITYSLKDDTEASAAGASSNCDVGATFRCRLDDGAVGVHKIPGFPISKAASNRNIPVDDADVAAYFLNFYDAGALRMSDGQVITAVLSGKMDV